MSKAKLTPKSILLPTAVLLIICIAAAALLGFTDSLTREKIASIDAENKAKAMAEVMPQAKSFGEEAAIGDSVLCSPAIGENGEAIGYAFTVTESGYGGEIQVMVGIGAEGVISKVAILAADNETPGLGQNVKKSSFLDQFTGKSQSLEAVKGSAGDNEIQAVTSATISSSAVTRAVNSAIEAFAEVTKGGGLNG